jgi:hypothetical protein
MKKMFTKKKLSIVLTKAQIPKDLFKECPGVASSKINFDSSIISAKVFSSLEKYFYLGVENSTNSVIIKLNDNNRISWAKSIDKISNQRYCVDYLENFHGLGELNNELIYYSFDTNANLRFSKLTNVGFDYLKIINIKTDFEKTGIYLSIIGGSNEANSNIHILKFDFVILM